jgi:carbon monoxide dehydrogenase subunit G
MKLDNEFAVGIPIDQAWLVLTDLERIAPCMPGAQLTGVEDGIYSGKVKIKVGPVTAEYAGTAKFAEKDDSAYRAVIDARGRDSRGQGNATAIISAQLRSDGASTVVTVSTDLSIAGRIAQFGSGMIKEVSAKLLTQFVECLEATLNAAPDVAAQREESEQAADGSDPALAVAADGQLVAAPVPAMAGVQAPQAGQAPLNLISVAGGAIYKRLIPVAIAVIVIIVVIILVVR